MSFIIFNPLWPKSIYRFSLKILRKFQLFQLFPVKFKHIVNLIAALDIDLFYLFSSKFYNKYN